jgi:Domain of unknown function (DUF6265)
MRSVIFAALLSVAAIPQPTTPQRPDLTGSWVSTSEAPADLPAAPGAVLGQRFWIRHAGDTFTIVRPVRDSTVAAALPLDGREVRTTIPGGVCQGDAQSIETASWEGNAIAFTVVGSVPPGGGAATKLSTRRLFRLQSPDMLVIEASMRESAGGGGAMRRVGTVYKRSTDPEPTPPQRSPAAAATIAQIAWLSGTWIGVAGTTTVEERWTPVAGGSLLGVARTLRNGVMASFEFLCIAERHGALVYTAMPNARTPATDFMSTAVTADGAMFENPAHDFPKSIRYARLPDGSLQTTVAGDAKQKPEVFVLKRQ